MSTAAAADVPALAGPATRGVLWALMPADGLRQFERVYGYFRWADDIVDAPGRDPVEVAAFVASQQQLLDPSRGAGVPPARLHPPEQALLLALSEEPGLRPIVDRMWQALAFDASRGPEPIAEADLALQIERVGDAYVEALWACSRAPGEPTAGARLLARAATATHALRDLHVDLALGYVNVPAEAIAAFDLRVPDRLEPWWSARIAAIDGWFAQGFAELSAIPTWRTRALVAAYAWRYRRTLRSLGRRDARPT